MDDTNIVLLVVSLVGGAYWFFLRPLWARAKLGVGWAASSLVLAAVAPIAFFILIVRLVTSAF